MEKRPKGYVGWKSLLFFGCVVVALILSAAPTIKVSQKAARRVSASNSCKAIAGGLIAFRQDRGTYPCDATREHLIEKGLQNVPNGSDANAHLAQLIITNVFETESIFHCDTGRGFHKGDDKFDTSENILTPGENSFAYVMAPGGKSITPTASMTPLIITPIISGDLSPTFDPDLFGGFYVYGTASGSGHMGKVSSDGVALSKGRDHLFQTGEDSLFGKETPVVKAPTQP